MLLKKIWFSALVCSGLAVFWAGEVQAEDWMQKSVEVAGGGSFYFEFPESWGKKPKIDSFEGVTTVRFGPYGPKKKPIFLVHLESVTAVDPISSEALLKLAEDEAANHKKIAAETSISINDLSGPTVAGHYFSVTDRESKMGEFDYLTLAILSSSHLLVKCYFFSSDGAPDFGADAMQMMRSIKYLAPPPEPEEET